jgi:RND family efflux transporter MFP subunit
VVQVAPDVGGLVTAVYVHDNQPVRRGQPLFEIDRPRYALAVEQAQAQITSQRVVLAQAKREDRRNRELGDLVSAEAREQGASRIAQIQAALAAAATQADVARLNLQRTRVAASVNGVIANLELRPGDYVTAGHPAMALIDAESLHVDGYFEETKLSRIRIGDRVVVRLMGEGRPLYGRVQSIAPGIEDRERAASPNLLPNVNPTFSWVRLAQRVPVRVVLDRAPADVRLIAGRTATVTVLAPRLAGARR